MSDWFGEDEDLGPIYIYFREVNKDESLNEDTIDTEEKKERFMDVLQSFDNQMKSHDFSQLDLNANPENWIKSIVDSYPEVQTMICQSLINNFSDSLHTRQREEGKYTLLIVVKDSIYICHTDADAKTVSTDMEVITRLLDIDNVDKLINFRKKNDGIEVRHYEKHRSKSLSDWLGLPKGHIAYGDAGNVKIYTQIGNATAAFEFSRSEFEEKFITKRNFKIENDSLMTPDGSRPIEQIKLGRNIYEEPREFKQEFYTLFYDINLYVNRYDELMSSMDIYDKKVLDYEDEVSAPTADSRYLVKENDKFDILFCNSDIQLSNGFMESILERWMNNTQVKLFHAGGQFSQEAVVIGSLEIHNEELEIGESILDTVEEIYELARNTYSGEPIRFIFLYLIFSILENSSEEPLSHFFDQMKEHFISKIDVNGSIIEEENGLLEFKDRDWFVNKDKDELAEDIVSETQGESKILIGGINEQFQSITPLSRSRFKSDKVNSIKENVLDQEDDIDRAEFDCLPLEDDQCLLLFMVSRSETDVNLGSLFDNHE